MAFVTLCVTRSRGFRARLHNGAWLWKFLIFIGIGVGVFAIPQERIGHFQMGILLKYFLKNLKPFVPRQARLM